MNAILAVDTTTGAWRAVCEYVNSRIAELTETCTSTGSTAEEKHLAAQRIDELRDLLSAPGRTRVMTEHALNHKPIDGSY